MNETPREVVLAIPDTHFPFHHRDTFQFLQAVREAYQPTQVIHMGDLDDQHALSDYDHDPDGDSPGKEFERALVFNHQLYEMFPVVGLCYSNHDARPFRRAYKYGIPKAYLRSYEEFLQLPEGWKIGPKFQIDGVIYEHGEGQSGELGAIRAAKLNMQSTTIGHIHSKAGVLWHANPKCLIFGFNAGCLVDKDAYAMAYGKHLKDKPVLGAGIITRGVPTFIPMLLKRGGRWVGQL